MSTAQSLTRHKAGYIPGIDGLRALAVLAVILFHLDASLLPGGFSGVDVFFVISGFVVSGSLAREMPRSFWSFVCGFYARRVVRIYPALVVCLVVAALWQSLLVPHSWLSSTSNNTGLFAFFGLSNFALTWFDDGYFAPRVDFNAFTHTWSLAVEEQFYLLFPLVFYVWLKWRERRDALGLVSRWLLAAILVASLWYCWRATLLNPDHAYYRLPSRFWELACGALLFKLHKRSQLLALPKRAGDACVVAGLVLTSLGLAFSDPKAFPFPWAMLSVAGAMLVIAGVGGEAGQGSLIRRVLENRLAVYIGKISYSLYLWHWPVLVMFRWTVGLQSPGTKWAAIGLTVLLSTLSYHFIETPFRKSRFVVNKPDWSVLWRGAALVLAGFGVCAGVFWAQPHMSLSVTRDQYTWYAEPWPASAQNAPARSPSRPFKGRGLFVLGDSHAGSYATLLRRLGDEEGIQVHTYSKGGCAAASLLTTSEPDCAQYVRQKVDEIKKLAAPGDIVFLASLRMHRLGNQWNSFPWSEVQALQQKSGTDAQRRAVLQEADALIAELEGKSLVVVMDAPKPLFRSPPFRCSDWYNKGNPVCSEGFSLSRNFLLAFRKPAMDSARALQRKHPALVVWDTFPALCPAETCSAFDGAKPLFFDDDHLSAHGNRVLYPSFLATLDAIWSGKPRVAVQRADGVDDEMP